MRFVDPLAWRSFSYEVEESSRRRRRYRWWTPSDETERNRMARQADVLVSSGTMPLDAAAIGNLDLCVGLPCCSVGMDAVDLAASEQAGIMVVNVNDAVWLSLANSMAISLRSRNEARRSAGEVVRESAGRAEERRA